jgi:hypothetical protein
VHSPQRTPQAHSGGDQQSHGTTLRTRAANLVGVSGKDTNSTPFKRARVDRNLMDTLDRLADSTAEIERLRIEVALTMHKDNLIERQENRKLELEMFRLQHASGERMVAMFAEVVKKILGRSFPRQLWFRVRVLEYIKSIRFCTVHLIAWLYYLKVRGCCFLVRLK